MSDELRALRLAKNIPVKEMVEIKLRAVYDMFVTKFPWIARLLPFDRFTQLVDEALEEMKNLLAENPALIDDALVNK